MNKVDYKGKYKMQLQKNLNDVLPSLNNKDFVLKIKNWAYKFGYSFDEIREKIIQDEVFRCVFAKDPSKQGFHQALAADVISSMDAVEDFKVLSSSGLNATYLSNGKLFTGKDLRNKYKDTKSVDFYWKCRSFEFYACHKYTDIAGGGQDNQYKDVQDFLRHSRDCNEKNVIFVAICDGDYYLKKDAATGDGTKLARLERLTDGKTSFVRTIDDLEDFLNKIK